MSEELTRAEYEALLRQDFTTFVARCFHELNPQAELGDLLAPGRRRCQ